jgi:uncharacterized protein (TIGR02391 family)
MKALNGLVRMRSGEALDGTPLMQKVFSPNAPVLQFNPMSDQSDKDEQLGFMMMYSGAVAGLRNPGAHRLIKDDPERALEFIAFVSLTCKAPRSSKENVAAPITERTPSLPIYPFLRVSPRLPLHVRGVRQAPRRRATPI